LGTEVRKEAADEKDEEHGERHCGAVIRMNGRSWTMFIEIERSQCDGRESNGRLYY
jgi:hypothetical protein